MPYTDAEVSSWVETARMIHENAVEDTIARATSNAAANIMSASGFLDARREILTMFDQLIEAGYAHALRDVRDGRYDTEIESWRG